MSKKLFSILSVFVLIASFSLPSVAAASTLTSGQVQAIIGLLQAFNVDQATIASVQATLTGTPTSPGQTPPVTPAPPTPTPVSPYIPPAGSLYPSSAIGYDISFNTTAYPVDRFGFAVIGVTRGKAFIHNSRLASEFSWAHFASAVQPTLYMNLNAPYGSTVAGHIDTPKTCSTQAAATGAEPTPCEGYNYGYQAAADAYAYATANSVSAPFWWLDIEEANSWSLNTEVNDETIQGAIDYLTTKNIKVGIYSMHYMWKAIAGDSFVPLEKVNGTTIPVPTWLPIGITDRVGAINACVTRRSFIAGSPIWIVQYVLSSTSVDQNLAC